MFKQPLLGEGGGVAGIHEDPVVTFAAVHATATDRVVQGLVLQDREVISQAVMGIGKHTGVTRIQWGSKEETGWLLTDQLVLFLARQTLPSLPSP